MLFDSIAHLGTKPHNLAVSMMGGMSNLLRTGVTTTPTFQAANFLRDTLNAFTLSKGKIVPMKDAIQATWERMYNDEHYWLYLANGGGFATLSEAEGINRDRLITSPMELLRRYDRALSALEYGPRLAEFKTLIAKGWSAKDAALAGREISTDFAMRGSSDSLRAITAMITFLNARLQGAYRNVRELAHYESNQVKWNGKQAWQYALRSFGAITLPTLLLYFINRDDEDYQELEDYKRDLYWPIPIPGQTGPDKWFYFPKPFETGFLWGTLFERSIEALDEQQGRELGDAIKFMLLETFKLNPIPQGIRPAVDVARNRGWTGAPIVPEYLLMNGGVDADMQYGMHTSDAMVMLGEKLGISPARAEYLVKGYLGTWGSYAIGMADFLVGDVQGHGEQPTKRWQDNVLISRFVDYGPIRRTNSEQELYDLLKEARRVSNTLRAISRMRPDRIEDYATDEERQAFMGVQRSLESWAEMMSELRNAERRIRTDPNLSGDEKEKQLHDIQRAKNQISKEVRQAISPDTLDEMANTLKKRRGAGGE